MGGSQLSFTKDGIFQMPEPIEQPKMRRNFNLQELKAQIDLDKKRDEAIDNLMAKYGQQ